MKKIPLWLRIGLLIVLMAPVRLAQASSPDIVISQVYGGGGNSGAPLRNDFVELVNRSAGPVSISGWTIQYTSASGSTWDATTLSGTIQSGQYYMVTLALGGTEGALLPPGDATGTTNLNATSGKIALVNNSTLLVSNCPSDLSIVDFVGYGTANCSETLPAPSPSNSTALLRAAGGCTDSDNNRNDFSNTSVTPRTSASTRNTCGTVNATGPVPPVPQPAPPAGTFVPLTAPLIFPHFAQGGGYQTVFTFNNLSSSPTTVTLDFFSQSGLKTGTTTMQLAALGSGKYSMSGTTLTVGWARASFTGPADIAGNETIQLFNGSGSLIMEASVFSAQPDTTLRLPVLENNAFKTGVAIVNMGPATSTVSLTLRATDGTAQPAVTISLGSLQQTARFVSELFTGVSNFEGTMEISAASPLAGLALRQNVAGIFSTVPVSPQSAEADFSPAGGISARIVQEIQRAQTSIDIEMYEFTRDEIADALIAAKNNGVTIRIIADNSVSGQTGSDIVRLQGAGISLKQTEGGGGGIMHNKVAIFDGRLLLTGSYNWSTAAETSNDENALFIRTPSIIAAYQSIFNFLWTTR